MILCALLWIKNEAFKIIYWCWEDKSLIIPGIRQKPKLLHVKCTYIQEKNWFEDSLRCMLPITNVEIYAQYCAVVLHLSLCLYTQYMIDFIFACFYHQRVVLHLFLHMFKTYYIILLLLLMYLYYYYHTSINNLYTCCFYV